LNFEDLALLMAFFATSIVVGRLSAQSAHKAQEVEARRMHIERLYLGLQQKSRECQRATEALHKAHEELEVRVDERTSELQTNNTRLALEVVDRKQAEERIPHMAHHDILTGLPNRALLKV